MHSLFSHSPTELLIVSLISYNTHGSDSRKIVNYNPVGIYIGILGKRTIEELADANSEQASIVVTVL